jgi:hypothetical protein
MARAAHRLLYRYRAQLLTLGTDYGALSAPEDPSPSITASAPRPGREIGFDRDHGFALTFPPDRATLAAVKDLTGRRFDPQTKAWYVPLAGAATLQPFARRFGFTITPAALRALDELQLRQEISTATDADVHIPTLRGELRPFQRAGVAYLSRAKRAFLADEMGLGKTIEAIATLENLDAFPALVVCPASLKLNWARELKSWLPHRSVELLAGRAPSNPLFAYGIGAQVTVANYDILSGQLEALRLRGFKAVVFDECHYLKSGSSQRSEAAKAVADGVDTVLMLSGTPLLNRPGELLHQLQVIHRLDDLGGWRDFNRRYCGYAGTTVLSELNKRLRAVCYVRRLKQDVLTELPPKQRSVVPIDIDNRREYDYAQRQLIQWIRERALTDSDFLATLPADLGEEQRTAALAAHAQDKADRAQRAEQLVRIERLKLLAAQGKARAAVRWIENFLESGEKLVVFGWHNEVLDFITNALESGWPNLPQMDRDRSRASSAIHQGGPPTPTPSVLAVPVPVRDSSGGRREQPYLQQVVGMQQVPQKQTRPLWESPVPAVDERQRSGETDGPGLRPDAPGHCDPAEVPSAWDPPERERKQIRSQQSVDRPDRPDKRLYKGQYLDHQLASQRDQAQREPRRTTAPHVQPDPKIASIRASLTAAERQSEINRFQTDPACRLIVCSLKAGGLGITLTAASNVAFVEMGWTPTDMDQAEDRCHRIGQQDSVTAWYLLAHDTIEEWIAELIDGKRAVTGAVAQGEATDAGGNIMAALTARLLDSAD